MLATPIFPASMASLKDQALYAQFHVPTYRLDFEPEAPSRFDAKGLTYAQHEMLRQRKTPYGIMVEENDNVPPDRSIQFPASKHVLLSKSPDVNRRTNRPRQKYTSSSNVPAPVNGANAVVFHGQQDEDARSQQALWGVTGGIDSILHQTTPFYGTQHLYPGCQVPTVLPASFKSHLGPTASAGQQFYGPYWPDGTYTPYRPAPVRDYRFDQRESHFEHMPHDIALGQRTLRRPGRLPDLHMSQDFVPHDLYYAPQAGQSPNHQAGYLHPSGYEDAVWHRPSGTMLHQPTYRDVPGAHLSHPIDRREPLSSLLDSGIRTNKASDRIAFRDRTFTYAHRVYVDLLSKIQRETKISRAASGASGQARSFNKPAIFPRPPQRTGSHFNDESSGANGEGDRLWSKDASFLGTQQKLPQRPRTAVRSSTQRDSEPSTQHSPSSFSGRTQPNNGYVCRNGHPAPAFFTPGSNVSSGDPGNESAAVSALESMELLCQEAEKLWTDGMLLAGCLAYGLGFYDRALGWYEKILAQDPDHVEARSNAAATLLALNRREEALRYWHIAVTHRPSYFEAVEHLVGLLCSTQRAREAVNVIDGVETALRSTSSSDVSTGGDSTEEDSDTPSRASSITTVASNETAVFEYDADRRHSDTCAAAEQHAPGFGSSGFSIPGCDNGRILALIHAKGNMLYALGDNRGAAGSFENAILIATGQPRRGMKKLILQILRSCISNVGFQDGSVALKSCKEPILLSPERAQKTAERMFPPTGQLPGLEHVPAGLAYRAAVSTTSNSLLSLAKIYQDGMNSPGSATHRSSNGTREILALYYLSLSLQRSPSTANNVGILLASVQQSTNVHVVPQSSGKEIINYTGIIPGSGIELALRYYNYGLQIDPRHAHLYTNLGSLLKDLGHLAPAISMYTRAVEFDPKFDIALANLANAVKDQGRIADAITYYRRAVQANPDFAEAVCGLATALNSVCNWYGRGGVFADGGKRDRIHVDDYGMMHEARRGFGWMNRVVEIVQKQLRDGEHWGVGTLTVPTIDQICSQLTLAGWGDSQTLRRDLREKIRGALHSWAGSKWEGARVVRLIERAIRCISWQWYQDRHVKGKEHPAQHYTRPTLPASLTAPTAPTVLPFHTFTTPLSAKQVRQISQRNALRISVSTLRSSWLPSTVYPPPKPPAPCLRVGYVSSDFNNHPLAHLMQSIFGLHDPQSVRAYCYATTSSDSSIHRRQIEHEAPVFHDASTWSVERLVNQVIEDGIHILVNLNGYTRGARNEVFAARPAPVHMSFMGFAGTLGAEWCDYVFADPISVSTNTLSPRRQNTTIEDRLHPDALLEDDNRWIYAENIIFARSTFFCVDHKQSSPDARLGPPPTHDRRATDLAWLDEQHRRRSLRRELFPHLSDTAVILGNFNQLYKIDPSTFRLYLRILAGVPNAVLWLLRFPDVGEQNLMTFAREWAGHEVASRIIFTDVAPKDQHITRASVVDLFVDTPECNAHTTAADVIWSGTPIITWARWEYKMCSRMASSIVASAFPEGAAGDEARTDLLVVSEEAYERQAIRLASDLQYNPHGPQGTDRGRLLELRRMLWEGRWSSRLFDTQRWVRDLETAYWKAWVKWEKGEGGDIWL